MSALVPACGERVAGAAVRDEQLAAAGGVAGVAASAEQQPTDEQPGGARKQLAPPAKGSEHARNPICPMPRPLATRAGFG